MKKIFTVLIVLTATLTAQYNTERSTEQSFENSDIFFQSTFVNTFGLKSFEDIIPGFIDDPYINAH